MSSSCQESRIDAAGIGHHETAKLRQTGLKRGQVRGYLRLVCGGIQCQVCSRKTDGCVCRHDPDYIAFGHSESAWDGCGGIATAALLGRVRCTNRNIQGRVQ